MAGKLVTLIRQIHQQMTPGQTYLLLALTLIPLIVLIYSKYAKPSYAPTALEPSTYKKFKLIEKTQVNHNVTIFRFALDHPNQRLGLPVGQHMFLRYYDSAGKPISRAYTPISSDDELGYFDLLIKLYPDGKMSQYLSKRQVGDYVDVRGPSGHLVYHGKGKFEILTKGKGKVTKNISHVGMIAGGSGITPMLQIVRAVSKDKNDHLHKSLIFGNVTTNDILLRDELDAVKKINPRFNIHYCVDKKPDHEWEYSVGYITPELIQKHLPKPADDTLILLCGPKVMCDIMTKHLTEKLNYTEDMIFSY